MENRDWKIKKYFFGQKITISQKYIREKKRLLIFLIKKKNGDSFKAVLWLSRFQLWQYKNIKF